MPAKLAFFASTASIMLPYIQIFQSDAPLVPFVISELQILLEILMGKFVKWKELEKLDSASKISEFDVSLSEHPVASKDIDVGFVAKALIDKLIKDKKVSDLQVLEFRKECQAMLVGTVTKIQERSPLKILLARKLISVDPRLIASNPESAIKMFQQALQQLIEARWNTPGEGDTILAQFRRFIAEAWKYNKDKFASFQHENMRLDCFYSEMLEAKEEYKDLWWTLQLLLTLSHSQAAVERGFSVNKEVLAPNMQEESLQAIRLIHSCMLAQKISVADFVIPEKLLSSCYHAWNWYRIYLLEKKTDKEETETGQKRKALQEDLAVAKKKKLEFESVAKKLFDSANKKLKEAEKMSDLASMKAKLIESNTSKERVQKIEKKDIPAQVKEIKEIEQKIANI